VPAKEKRGGRERVKKGCVAHQRERPERVRGRKGKESGSVGVSPGERKRKGNEGLGSEKRTRDGDGF
jgi:hypothetical protein